MEFCERRNAPRRADTWFVYALVDSRNTEEIRYIGITNNPFSRMGDHLREGGREGTHKSYWVKSVLDDGGKVLIGILKSGLAFGDAKSAEVALIASHRDGGSPLTNLTDGGDGTAGYSMSPESRRKLSDKRRGQPGRPHTDETKAMISAANKGSQRTDSFREKMSLIMAGKPGRKHSPETKAKISAGNIGKIMPREAVEIVAAKNKGSKRTPDQRDRAVSSLRAFGVKNNNSSGYKGVSFHRNANKWRAAITVNRKSMYLGVFVTAEEAAEAYDAAAITNFGPGCYLNFPDNSLAIAA